MMIAISKKKDGSMRVSQNKISFLKKNGLNPENLIMGGLSHGSNTKTVDGRDRGKIIDNVDGLITASRGIILAVTVADCFPVFFFSEKIFGILHAGWRGIEKGIVEKALEGAKAMGENEDNLSFFVGPGIGVCHYEVKQDVLKRFEEFSFLFKKRENKIYLPLKGIIEEKLKKLGVSKIKMSSVCTYCDQNYFSFRRDKQMKTMLAIITDSKYENIFKS